MTKQPPPLQVAPNQWLSVPSEQTAALHYSLLARFDARSYVETWENGQTGSIPWSGESSLEEVTASTIGSKETAPKYEKITVRLLKACWGTIGTYVRDLFQVCLNLEYFPSPFKTAEVALLPKIGRHLSSPKG